MKYIILLISLSFAQVIAPIGMGEKEHKVTWCISIDVQDPCPDMWTRDEFGRDIFYGCLVYHFHIDYDCDHSKYFDSYEEAEKFAKKANKESGITDVKLDGVLIQKPVKEWIPIAVDSCLTVSDLLTFVSSGITDEEWAFQIGLTTDIALTNEEMRLQQPITFGDVLDYAEECYNDTTWGHKDVIHIIEPEYYIYELDSDYINNGICYLRKRVMLGGFIEWLKK